ncbi:ATP-binding cassette domain-containing protein (plasmid) [Sphingobium sp. V4]|uniref:ATP-binding cassette domain-containing protein n=1 Tax=Sphingobium sp. V4 TaxID=3038927 RepID=UPI002557F85B|nr:ATP-binding cassette domain-containing protein [Sphingobium sp. V4]WIW90497.1 ATP-binding cassette domain-containing protein [Sphingobium sp. V4]
MIAFPASRPAQALFWALCLTGGIAGALLLNGYYAFVIGQIALLVIAGIGLNILIGLSGEFSFGHAAFYAIGAYTVAICTSRGWLPFWIAWPISVVVATGIGALLALPALRVKGPYLAMVTIAFGLIVEQTLVEAESLTGGQSGILQIAPISIGGIALSDRAMAIVAILTAGLVMAAYHRLSRNGWGAAMRAVRDSDHAAASIGIDPLYIRIVAFMASAACCALAGGLSAPLNSFVTPQSFGLSFSIVLVLVVVIGGAGARSGPVLGAIVIGLLPELLSSLEAYRVLAYAALVLVVLWIAPGGMAGLLRIGQTEAAPDMDPTPLADRLSRRARVGLHGRSLAIHFGGVRAIDALDIDIPAGIVTALIGPNGAGKSTVINMLSGFYRPDEGTRMIGDTPLPPGRSFIAARAGIARTYQSSALFDSMSVEENILLALHKGRPGRLLGVAARDSATMKRQAHGLLRACGYAGAPSTPASALAHVDRRLVEIARALAIDPDVMLLDEPAAGLSQGEKRVLGDLLRSIAAAGIGVALVEHDMGLVMGVADRVVVLRTGALIATGTPAQVQADPLVREAYLGERSVRQSPPAIEKGGEPALGAYAIHAGYGAGDVLHGIDVELRKGESVALLGANGAGKSTLMRILSGLMPAGDGHLRLEGKQINGRSVVARVRAGLVLVPEGRQVFPELSVRDNLRLGAYTCRAGMAERLDAILAQFPRLTAMLDRRAGLLSGGEQQMLAVGRALMAQPRILLLDEPSLGLSPQATSDLFDQLAAIRDEGMAMLIVDQMADLALSLSSRAYLLHQGHITKKGFTVDMAAGGALETDYLSGSTQ